MHVQCNKIIMHVLLWDNIMTHNTLTLSSVDFWLLSSVIWHKWHVSCTLTDPSKVSSASAPVFYLWQHSLLDYWLHKHDCKSTKAHKTNSPVRNNRAFEQLIVLWWTDWRCSLRLLSALCSLEQDCFVIHKNHCWDWIYIFEKADLITFYWKELAVGAVFVSMSINHWRFLCVFWDAAEITFWFLALSTTV